jgi:predicted DNA-binding protein (UPF0251 family)
MPRPKAPRSVRFRPDIVYFKPQGVPMRMLDEVELLPDELEAIKLHDIDGLDQNQSARRMNISQPTFGRILDGAYKKVARALIKGKALRLIRSQE